MLYDSARITLKYMQVTHRPEEGQHTCNVLESRQDPVRVLESSQGPSITLIFPYLDYTGYITLNTLESAGIFLLFS